MSLKDRVSTEDLRLIIYDNLIQTTCDLQDITLEQFCSSLWHTLFVAFICILMKEQHNTPLISLGLPDNPPTYNTNHHIYLILEQNP